MSARWLAAALALVPATAQAGTRSFAVASFERVRVDGPFEVSVTTGGSPGASASGDDDAIDRLDVSQQGETLVVRIGTGGWGERPARTVTTPVAVTLSTPLLRTVAVNAGGRVTVTRIVGQHVTVSVNGAAALSVAAIDADQLDATLIGAGTMTLAGRAGAARLITSGPGAIDAAKLVANDLIVRLDGIGETRANARYTARVSNAGLGHVSVAGGAKCVVAAPGGGPVECGATP